MKLELAAALTHFHTFLPYLCRWCIGPSYKIEELTHKGMHFHNTVIDEKTGKIKDWCKTREVSVGGRGGCAEEERGKQSGGEAAK